MTLREYAKQARQKAHTSWEEALQPPPLPARHILLAVAAFSWAVLTLLSSIGHPGLFVLADGFHENGATFVDKGRAGIQEVSPFSWWVSAIFEFVMLTAAAVFCVILGVDTLRKRLSDHIKK